MREILIGHFPKGLPFTVDQWLTGRFALNQRHALTEEEFAENG
jgi:hypothetical protein